MKYIPDDELVIPEVKLGTYQHYKGKRYEVIGIGLNSETDQPMVIYKPLYPSRVSFWVRPYDMFHELVESKGKTIPRFRYEGDRSNK